MLPKVEVRGYSQPASEARPEVRCGMGDTSPKWVVPASRVARVGCVRVTLIFLVRKESCLL